MEDFNPFQSPDTRRPASSSLQLKLSLSNSTHECFPIMHGHSAYSMMKKKIGQHLSAVMHFHYPYWFELQQSVGRSAPLFYLPLALKLFSVADLLTSLKFEHFHQTEPVLVLLDRYTYYRIITPIIYICIYLYVCVYFSYSSCPHRRTVWLYNFSLSPEFQFTPPAGLYISLLENLLTELQSCTWHLVLANGCHN